MSMNYQQACDRLDKPHKKSSKKIGHKLTLSYGDDAVVILQYFSTNIITWYPDGGVRIRADGFWDSQCTRDKINEYTPRGWTMWTHNLSFDLKQVCATINIRTDTWELVRSMPYSNDVRFFETGRSDHRGTALTDLDACAAVHSVAATVKESVMAFLYGELPQPCAEEDLAALAVDPDYAGRRTSLIVEIATSKKASGSLVWAVIDAEWKNSFRMNQIELYDPKVYPLTGKPRNNKERIAQMEHFMRVGNSRTRYAKNSEEFHALKKDLMAECELFLLRELGFEVKERERRERSHTNGW